MRHQNRFWFGHEIAGLAVPRRVGGYRLRMPFARRSEEDPDLNLLQPGEETEGVVIFGRADPSQPLQVSFAWQHGGYMADKPEPIVFGFAP